MKRIKVDCNFNFLGPSKPVITPKEVEKFDLVEGERVIAFQDEDEWEGTVVYDGSLENYNWYIKLD